ncbi:MULTISPECIES: decaprenyl-phosphate phosphoribosyltransferase [unclassified Acinetobacter]|uniref:decaprenyl-phosphate phosphoribosyltransferase n=1 Tax=unclassified Acinetobacter TaxID=196816 RepID=UPI0029350168|nr:MULTISPECIES: decaprenyl-phosphate phosphoribosyltransferase [unclassified Acinetobacter]WOE31302.1 decaprenyl-phosphate phosphoribosyltransferase [Acinetobacter sp. SAAs470]WOE39498.1 decaprenyl-phosphate phosphoribosyltransferase [Acinetobacter sp. SAAs474]
MYDHIILNKSILGEIKGLIKLIRPKQWVKNSFVCAPLIFSGLFLHLESIESTIYAVLFFCLAASSVYIINDLKDIDQDRIHPEKSKKRPLASGEVSIKSSIIFLILIYILIGFCWLFNPHLLYVIIIYLALNFAYTFKLKHKPVIEIFIVAFGFVLRVYAGAVALNVPISDWMFVTTLSISLYLASIKRRQELIHNGSQSRGVLEHYSISLIDRFAEMAAVCSIIFYSLYVMSVQPKLIITIPFVMFGLYRYWFIVETCSEGESPTDIIVQDIQILTTVFAWITCCIWVLIPHF